MSNNKQEKLGLIAPDYADKRDYLLGDIQPERIVLPDKYLPMDEMTSIQNQNWGTCTSHSVDGVKEHLDKKEYEEEIKLSQKFIYYNTKKISNLWGIQGDYLRNAIKSVVEYGACKEETFPDIKRNSWEEYIADVPPPSTYVEAEEFKAKTYWRVEVNGIDTEQAIYNLKAARYRNGALLPIGIKWAKEYNNPSPDGHLPLPQNFVGGHAISFVGWDNDKLWFRNSHGTGYGFNGYFYVLESEFGKHIWWDAWVILDVFYDVRLKIIAALRKLIALYQELIERLKK